MTRGLIAWALMLTGWIAILADIVRLNITGLAVAGVTLLTIALWILGVFRREFWVADIPETHPDALGSLDHLERAHIQDQDHGTDIQR